MNVELRPLSRTDIKRLASVCDRLFLIERPLGENLPTHLIGLADSLSPGRKWRVSPTDCHSEQNTYYDELLDAFSIRNTADHIGFANGAKIVFGAIESEREYPLSVVPSAFAATMLKAFEDTDILSGALVHSHRTTGSVNLHVSRAHAIELVVFAAYYMVEVAKFAGEGFKSVEATVANREDTGLEVQVKFTKHTLPSPRKRVQATAS